MKFRKDITEYFIEGMGDTCYKRKDFKFYEQDGLLYAASYNMDKPNKIDCYGDYTFFDFNGKHPLGLEIEVEFDVKFSEGGSDVVCRCGKSDSFSAFYGDYRISLRCKCGNEFSAYSG